MSMPNLHRSRVTDNSTNVQYVSLRKHYRRLVGDEGKNTSNYFVVCHLGFVSKRHIMLHVVRKAKDLLLSGYNSLSQLRSHLIATRHITVKCKC